MKRLLITLCGVFFGLYLVTTPFAYRVLPLSFLEEFYGFFLALSKASYAQVFQLPLESIYPELSSDSLLLYVHTFNLLVIALLLTALLHVLHRWKGVPLPSITFFRRLVSYYLSLQLLVYGLDKVLGTQFYFPEPNTLFTPLAQLDKDLLYWSTMATSKLYLIATGSIECLGAVLLWFRRTRYLGGLVTLAVMTQVVLINFGFDISVKLHSLVLWGMALFVTWPAIKALWALLVSHKSVYLQWPSPSFASGLELFRHLLFKAFVLFVILLEAGGPHVLASEAGNYQKNVVGAYEVLHVQKGLFSQDLCSLDSAAQQKGAIQRLFFHSKGYFIVEKNGVFKDYPLDLTNASTLQTWPMDSGSISMSNCSQQDLFQVHWAVPEQASSTFLVRKINLKELPISQDGFHWFMDDYAL